MFSIRTKLFEPLKEDVILDDFMLSLKVNLKGFRVKYEPKAKASELPSDSIEEERKLNIMFELTCKFHKRNEAI